MAEVALAAGGLLWLWSLRLLWKADRAAEVVAKFKLWAGDDG